MTRGEPPLVVAIPIVIVLGAIVLVLFALEDAYQLARRGYRRLTRATRSA